MTRLTWRFPLSASSESSDSFLGHRCTAIVHEGSLSEMDEASVPLLGQEVVLKDVALPSSLDVIKGTTPC
jgi:hypothetical protein